MDTVKSMEITMFATFNFFWLTQNPLQRNQNFKICALDINQTFEIEKGIGHRCRSVEPLQILDVFRRVISVYTTWFSSGSDNSFFRGPIFYVLSGIRSLQMPDSQYLNIESV